MGAGRPEPEPLLRVDQRHDPGRRVERDHAPVAEDRDAVGEALRLLHEVGHEEDRHAAVADRLDEPPCLAPGMRVEAGRQLVEDGDLRPADQREGDRQPLLLAARQIPIGGVALLRQPELVEQFGLVAGAS